MYAQKLEGDEWIGEKMDLAKIDKMSGKSRQIPLQLWTNIFSVDQQLGQLYELMQEIQKAQKAKNTETDGENPS